MLKNGREGITPDAEGSIGPVSVYKELQKKGFPLAYVGDVLGTGSSRKSATNSILWFFGEDIPNVPNKRGAGVCIGNSIAPIFNLELANSGALPLEMPVDKLNTGDVIDIYPYKGIAKSHTTGEVLAEFKLSTALLDEVRAGGRSALADGKQLTARARSSLNTGRSSVFQGESRSFRIKRNVPTSPSIPATNNTSNADLVKAAMAVNGPRTRGVLGHILADNIRDGRFELGKVQSEVSAPSMESHLFAFVMKLFVSLDAFVVFITSNPRGQFSSVTSSELEGKCTERTTARILALRDVRIQMKLGKRLLMQEPFHIWSSFKHRGPGDVSLAMDSNGEAILKIGELLVYRQELTDFAKEAEDVVRDYFSV